MFSQDFLCDVVDFMRGARWESKHKSANPCIKTQHELRVIRRVILRIIPLLSLLGLNDFLTEIRRILKRQVIGFGDVPDDFIIAVCADIGKKTIPFQVPSQFERYLIGCDFDILFKKIVPLPANEKTLERIMPYIAFFHSVLIWRSIRRLPKHGAYRGNLVQTIPYKTYAIRNRSDEAIHMFIEMYNMKLTFRIDILTKSNLLLDMRIVIAKRCKMSVMRCLEMFTIEEWAKNREFLKKEFPQLTRFADIKTIMKNPYQSDYSPLCHLLNIDKDTELNWFFDQWKYSIQKMFLKIAELKYFTRLPTNQQYLVKRVAYELVVKTSFDCYYKDAIRAWLNLDESNKPIPLKKIMAYQKFNCKKISETIEFQLLEED